MCRMYINIYIRTYAYIYRETEKDIRTYVFIHTHTHHDLQVAKTSHKLQPANNKTTPKLQTAKPHTYTYTYLYVHVWNNMKWVCADYKLDREYTN